MGRKIFTLLLCIVLATSLIACGNKNFADTIINLPVDEPDNMLEQGDKYTHETLSSALLTDNVRVTLVETGHSVAISRDNFYIREPGLSNEGVPIRIETYCFGSDLYTCSGFLDAKTPDKYLRGEASSKQLNTLKSIDVIKVFGISKKDCIEYIGTMEEYGIVYDVVRVATFDTVRYYLVNKDSSLVERILLCNPDTVESGEVEIATIVFTAVDSIKLPAEFNTDDVEEVPKGDIQLPSTLIPTGLEAFDAAFSAT